jgi:carbonic anhydrase/acetyltransferase-like protein (isoleucine patch superfamily)
MVTRAIRRAMIGGMVVEYRGRRPVAHESAWVAPTAVLCGDDLMARVMPRQAAWLGAHRDDRVL